jgi:hypothetical protein
VVKKGESTPVPGGCHSTRAQALAHQRALYANEPSMTAAAPLKPSRAWFDHPEPDHAEPLTVEPSGLVHGHLAPWDGCHAGMVNGSESSCVKPPRSATDYRMFHLGQLETAEGDVVAVGKVVAGGGHADIHAGLSAATKHYDSTDKVAAFVRARDGKHGIYLSGVLRSDVSPEVLRDFRANLPSGDWRRLDRNLELVGAVSVPVPGYGIPALVAAADSGEIEALILQGFTDTEEEMEMETVRDRSYQRRRDLIAADIDEPSMVAAVLTTKRREALRTSTFAIPEERKFPIHDASHARNALARAAGTKYEARVRRAVCRRYPNMGECKEGD